MQEGQWEAVPDLVGSESQDDGIEVRLWIACGALLSVALVCCALNVLSARASFPGSPGLIAVQRSPDSNKSSEIWVLDPQTGAARRLTDRGYAREPVFSPDGQWIAFVSDLPLGNLNIWAVRADGSGLHRLTKGVGELEPDSPAFSADGRWVAFSVEAPGGGWEIDRVAFAGGHPRILVQGTVSKSAVSPSYSPDGRLLAWAQSPEVLEGKTVPHIYIGRPNGRGRRRLTAGYEPEFSPDGRSIVLGREGRCGNGAVGTEIDTISLETGQLSHLKASCGAEIDAPTYSPDGGWVAYTIHTGERSEIGFSPVPGVVSSIAPPAGLGAELPLDADPSWQPIL